MKSAPARLIGRQLLEGHGRPVDPAPLGGRLDHGVLAAHVVGGHRHVDRPAHVGDDVEVGQRRLDHDDVGPLGDVEGHLGQRLAPVAPGPAGSRAGRRRRRWSRRPPRGTGRRGPRRTWRRRRARPPRSWPVAVEGAADGADLAVHHPAGRHDVGAGRRLGQRHPLVELEGGVVVDRAVGAAARRSGRGRCTRRGTGRR